MKINPITFINSNQIERKQKNQPLNELQADVFVKNKNSVSFKGVENDFIKWADESNFVQNLAETMADENIIGTGYSHTTYKIPDNENYVLRIPNYIQINNEKIPQAQIKNTMDDKLDINIGQQVALIEIPSEHEIFKNTIEVLKKQKGIPIGVKNPQTIKDGQPPYEAEERMQQYETTIKQVAQLPTESYEKLISNYLRANELGYKFDHLNSNNLLIDIENQSIGMIDMDKTNSKPNLGNLLVALSNSEYLNTYKSPWGHNLRSQEECNAMTIATVQIIDKYFQAMENMGLKFNLDERTIEFDALLNSIPCKFALRTFDYNGVVNGLSERNLI